MNDNVIRTFGIVNWASVAKPAEHAKPGTVVADFLEAGPAVKVIVSDDWRNVPAKEVQNVTLTLSFEAAQELRSMLEVAIRDGKKWHANRRRA